MNQLNETLSKIGEKFPENFGRFNKVVFVGEGSGHLLQVHVRVVELLLQQVQPEAENSPECVVHIDLK